MARPVLVALGSETAVAGVIGDPYNNPNNQVQILGVMVFAPPPRPLVTMLGGLWLFTKTIKSPTTTWMMVTLQLCGMGRWGGEYELKLFCMW